MDLLGPLYLINFEDAINELQRALLFVAYFILVAGLILKITRQTESDSGLVGLLQPILVSALLVGIIATLPFWFNRIDDGFSSLAAFINQDFASEPFAVTEALLETVEEDPEAEGFGVERILNTVYLSLIYGASKLAITTAALFQVPFFILQYVLKWLGFLFLPIGIALFIFPSLANIGVKMIANILAVMAWPIGFAITNLAAIGFINDFATSSTFTGNNTGSALFMVSFGSLILGIIASLILVVGTLATPTIMFILFSSGAILEGITTAVTGAAAGGAFAATGGFGGSGGSASGSAPSPSGGSRSGASSTSGYEGIGSSGGFTANEGPANYGASSVIDAGVLQPYSSDSPQGQGAYLSGQAQRGLPAAPTSAGQASIASPVDPSGGQQAATLFALTTTPKAITTI